jgi:hypothetical protein
VLPPDQDQTDRRPVWDALQVFWLDTDPAIDFAEAAKICARSKYSLPELEAIFWNELRPALRFNLLSLAGEWAGFEINWLSDRILKTNCFGCPLPIKAFRPGINSWWENLRREIVRLREH